MLIILHFSIYTNRAPLFLLAQYSSILLRAKLVQVSGKYQREFRSKTVGILQYYLSTHKTQLIHQVLMDMMKLYRIEIK